MIVAITPIDSEMGKKGWSNKMLFGCDKDRKYKEAGSATQSAIKNVVVHSKSNQHRKMV